MSISGPPNIGTPDGQRGVVSAQKLLATVPAGQQSVTVPIPPNAESLIIIFTAIPGPDFVEVDGATTGVAYAGIVTQTSADVGQGTQFFFDVSSAVDQSVNITVAAGNFGTWYVYSDNGIHLIADVSNLHSMSGALWVVPTVPGPRSGDAPVNELKCYSNWGITSGTLILPRLTNAEQYRIFYAQIQNEASGAVAGLSDTSSGQNFVLSGAGSINETGTNDFHPTGLLLPVDAGVQVGTTSGNATVNMCYTIQTP